MLAPASTLLTVVTIGVLICLAALGAIGARAGGAPIGAAALRVLVWGALAMAATAIIGRLAGTTL